MWICLNGQGILQRLAIEQLVLSLVGCCRDHNQARYIQGAPRRPASCVCWFINPINYSCIRYISYIPHKP